MSSITNTIAADGQPASPAMAARRAKPAPHIEYLKGKIEKAYGVLYVHTIRIEDEGSVYWIAEAEGDNNFAPSFRVIGHEQGSSEIEALDKLALTLGVAAAEAQLVAA